VRATGRSAGRVLALDVGEVRTGVAVSDPGATIARPLEIVPSGELEGFLAPLVEGEGVTEVVVGVPRTLGGEVGFQARRVLARLSALRDRFPGVRFVEWDERFTTRIAAGVLDGRGKKGRGGKSTRVDDVAAARMLQEYLEARGEI
jgi:putative holliday junction resolvase